jgi:hypothetical protein
VEVDGFGVVSLGRARGLCCLITVFPCRSSKKSRAALLVPVAKAVPDVISSSRDVRLRGKAVSRSCQHVRRRAGKVACGYRRVPGARRWESDRCRDVGQGIVSNPRLLSRRPARDAEDRGPVLGSRDSTPGSSAGVSQYSGRSALGPELVFGQFRSSPRRSSGVSERQEPRLDRAVRLLVVACY